MGYSLKMRKDGYTELEYRCIFTWGDFLLELEPLNLTNEEKETFNLMVTKGDKYQKNLEIDSNKFDSISDYLKFISTNLSLQDDVITNIKDYLKELEKFNKELEKN